MTDMKVLLLSLLLILNCCATLPPDAPPFTIAPDATTGNGLVYVYRLGTDTGDRTPDIFVDGKLLFAPPEMGYTWVHLPVGKHDITVDWNWDTSQPDLNFKIDVSESDPLFVKISDRTEYFVWGRYRLDTEARQVGKVTALWELKKCCKYLAPSPEIKAIVFKKAEPSVLPGSAGCASAKSIAPRVGAVSDANRDDGLIYAYRVGTDSGGRTPKIFFDGYLLLSLPKMTYTCMRLPSGIHKLTVDWTLDTDAPDVAFELDLVTGEPLIMKISDSLNRVFFVPRTDAERELQSCCEYIFLERESSGISARTDEHPALTWITTEKDVASIEHKENAESLSPKSTYTPIVEREKTKNNTIRLSKKKQNRERKEVKHSTEFTAAELHKQIAALSAEIEINHMDEQLGKRPRIRFINSVNAQKYKAAAYEKAFADKIERIGNLHYPTQVRSEHLSGLLLLAVGIRADGTLYRVEVRRFVRKSSVGRPCDSYREVGGAFRTVSA